MPNAYVATTDAVVNTPDGPAYLKRGVTRVVEGHQLLEEHPGFFKAADEDAHFGQPETARQEPRVPRRDAEDAKDQGTSGSSSESKPAVKKATAKKATAKKAASSDKG